MIAKDRSKITLFSNDFIRSLVIFCNNIISDLHLVILSWRLNSHMQKKELAMAVASLAMSSLLSIAF